MTLVRMLAETDPEVAELIKQETDRQEDGLELIASENIASTAVLDAMATSLNNKYAEGYPGKRYYGGCEVVDKVENLAKERLLELFRADHANVQPHSGASANLGAYFAVMGAGDTLMGLALPHGGHLTHGFKVSVTGQIFNSVQYEVNVDTGLIDLNRVRELAKQHRPKVIVAGGSAYPRIIDFAGFAAVAKEVDATFMVDMAHFAGLVAGGAHPNPVEFADLVTSTTHKTLRGPRGGVILCREHLAQAVDKSVFPGLQGGPLEHVIAAKAVAFGEALQPDFKVYARQVVDNASTLANGLLERGYDLVSGGTDTHLLLVDLRSTDITGKDAEERLGRANIHVNKNTVPGDPRSPFVTSGIRIGTPALTTRGMKQEEMQRVADMIDRVLRATDEAVTEQVGDEVRELTSAFPIYSAAAAA